MSCLDGRMTNQSSSMSATFDLDRFLDAQNAVYVNVLNELQQGQKRTHWMWFIFPQVLGLGHSPMAVRFAIRSRGEAEAFLHHPTLLPRLLECTLAVLAHKNKSAHDILGYPDDLKFSSSMTLFDVVGAQPIFHEAIARFYDGRPDPATLAILDQWTQ